MIGLVGSWALAFTSVMAAQCSPPTYFWEAFEKDYPGHCVQVQAVYQGLAYSDLILDAWVLALPIPMVASLKLPWKSKIKVIDSLLLGSVYARPAPLSANRTIADNVHRVFGSGIARVVSFMEAVEFTNHNPKTYFKDTLCESHGQCESVFRSKRTDAHCN